MFRKRIKPLRIDFTHLTVRIPAASLEKFGGNRISVLVSRFSDVVNEDFHSFITMPREELLFSAKLRELTRPCAAQPAMLFFGGDV